VTSPCRHPRKCCSCKELFHPSKRHPKQEFCARPACRKASKGQSQRQWLGRNPSYFRGAVHVERVRRWRQEHPGYSRGQQKRKAEEPLQDLVPLKVPPPEVVAANRAGQSSDFSPRQPPSESCSGSALQDLVLVYVPLVVGLISCLTGEALQETLVPLTRELVERGQRVLGQTVGGPGWAAPPQPTT